MTGQATVAVDQQARIVAGNGHQHVDLFGCGKTELRLSRLKRAQYFAGPAQAQILFGYAEAIIGFPQEGETSAGGFAESVSAQAKANGLLVAARCEEHTSDLQSLMRTTY